MSEPIENCQERDYEQNEVPEPKNEKNFVVQNVQWKNTEGVEPLEGPGGSVDLDVALGHLGEENILKTTIKNMMVFIVNVSLKRNVISFGLNKVNCCETSWYFYFYQILKHFSLLKISNFKQLEISYEP